MIFSEKLQLLRKSKGYNGKAVYAMNYIGRVLD